MTGRTLSIGLPPIVGEPVSLPVRGDRSPARSNGAIDDLLDPKGAGMSPARTARRRGINPTAPAPGIGSAPRISLTGGGLHRWATERFQMTRFLRLSKLYQGVIDRRVGRFYLRRRMVGALSFRVGPVQVSVGALCAFVENNIGTSRGPEGFGQKQTLYGSCLHACSGPQPAQSDSSALSTAAWA
jgi:hypothetical protein